MAPKKLTDCPENLRESIDWLIQIRHGGDGQGLGKLAGALKKLIKEAIENTYESLNKRESQLNCPTKSPSDDSNYCDKLTSDINQHDNAIKDLEAEITEDQNNSPSRKTDLNNKKSELSMLKSEKERHYNEVHYLSEDSRKKALGYINEQQRKLHDLKSKLEDFIGKQDDAKTLKGILEKLCDGFETFLGFNSETKGYTGKGIVYSDLDRMCDAVMAFLHGLLESVKGDESVKRFWVSVDTDLDKIKGELQKGQKGLKEFLPVVELGLTEFSDVLDAKTEELKDSLTRLNDRIEGEVKIFSRLTDKTLRDQLMQWKDTIKEFVWMSETTENLVRDLDPGFQKTLKTSVTVVKEAVKMMEHSAGNDGFMKAVETLQSTFDTLAENVERFIMTNVDSTVEEHKNKVEELKEGLVSSINALRNAFLAERLKLVKTDLGNAVSGAEEGALNLGGLNNEKVKKAVEAIESRLKTVDMDVIDADTLRRLAQEPVGTHSESIKDALNVKSAPGFTDELSSLMVKIKAPGEIFAEVYESKLRGFVELAKTDLQRALNCAKDNAKNLGGLNNAIVKAAISAIEIKLNDVESSVNTKLELDALASDVEEQIGHITQAKNIDGTTVTGALEAALQTIGTPKDTFQTHERYLTSLAEETQNDLMNAFTTAQQCIQKHGGLHRSDIKSAFSQIEKTLDEICKPNKDKEELHQVVLLVRSHLRQLQTRSADVDAFEARFEKEFERFTGPEPLSPVDLKLYTELVLIYTIEAHYYAHTHSFDSGGTQDTGISDIANNIKKQLELTKDVFSTDSIRKLHSTINQMFGPLQSVNVAFEKGVKTSKTVPKLKSIEIKNLETKIQEIEKGVMRSLVESAKSGIDVYLTSAQTIARKFDGTHGTKLDSALNNLESKLKDHAKIDRISELTTLVNEVDEQFGIVKTKVGKGPDESLKLLQIYIIRIQKPAWKALIDAQAAVFQNAIEVVRAAVVKQVDEAKQEITNAESEYQSVIGRHLMRIEETIKDFKDEAEGGTLESFLNTLNRDCSPILELVKTKTILQKDVSERTTYFENLNKLITDTVNSLSTAYKIAYKNTAKSYLVKAINTIKGAVESAEQQYLRVADVEVNKISFDDLTHAKFTKETTREPLSKKLNMPFERLFAAVQDNSAFQEDAKLRKECFTRLKGLIENTVRTLCAAYTEAYKCSAKSYLSSIIKEIKDKVEKAENKYYIHVKAEIEKIRAVISRLYDKQFQNKTEREELDDIFAEHFQRLQEQVKLNSAFKKDYGYRTTRYSDCKKLLDHTVKTLVTASEKFDTSLAAAIACLDQSFADAKSRTSMLGITIRATVNSAFENIISEVCGMYASQKKADLRALATMVEEQLHAIENIIKDNKNNGMKGFLKKIKMSLNLVQSRSSVSAYAEMLTRVFKMVFLYVRGQVTSAINERNATSLDGVKDKMYSLLKHLETVRKYNFDDRFSQLLSSLISSLASLCPSQFASAPHSELIDAIKKGLCDCTKELEKAYVNTYDSQEVEWVALEKKDPTNEKEKYAKIVLTITDLLDRDIGKLKVGWNTYSGSDINIILGHPLGVWFTDRGFTVSDSADKQNGELRNKIKGGDIKNVCESRIDISKNTDVFEVLRKVNIRVNKDIINLDQLLRYLYDRLDKYRRLCHLQHHPNAKPPTTICQMLHWLTGMECNPMYETMKTYLNEWYTGFRTEHKITDKKLLATFPSRTGYNVIQDLNLGNLIGSFENMVLRSPSVLFTILGHGDADGQYACDFYTNPYHLTYPSTPSKCFDLLVEVCLRLNHQLRFVYKMCHNKPKSSGWANCLYGKGIGGSRWQCNELDCPEKDCPAHCKTHYMCGIKSPLQSFLEDALPGFLPHHFSTTSCQITCQIPNHKGIPCSTPMGFRELSIRGSRVGTGDHIKDVLERVCGKTQESLSMLCAYFLCLLRRPPQTLCDMFAFYHNYLQNWEGDYQSKREDVQKQKQKAFQTAVRNANLGRTYENLVPNSIQVTSIHKSDRHNHLAGDMFTLVSCKVIDSPVHPCGSYLQPLSLDTRSVFTEKLAADYLSWIVYLTETFYHLLNELYKKCEQCCNEQRSMCYGRICSKECEVDSTDDAQQSKDLTDKKHDTKCHSIVQCPGIHATIYSFGFTFGSPFELSGEKNGKTKRTCKDFCTALSKIVGEECALVKLIDAIDDFLLEIRKPFIYTILSLWSYSLLYLLYVIIARLDTFHIRSHLRLPSSHKITAESLLATARLNNLAKLAYLRT